MPRALCGRGRTDPRTATWKPPSTIGIIFSTNWLNSKRTPRRFASWSSASTRSAAAKDAGKTLPSGRTTLGSPSASKYSIKSSASSFAYGMSHEILLVAVVVDHVCHAFGMGKVALSAARDQHFPSRARPAFQNQYGWRTRFVRSKVFAGSMRCVSCASRREQTRSARAYDDPVISQHHLGGLPAGPFLVGDIFQYYGRDAFVNQSGQNADGNAFNHVERNDDVENVSLQVDNLGR